jgi:ubiquinone/menaquinone biosynthesis C-methylase UbiE
MKNWFERQIARFFSSIFQRLYTSFAWSYDLVASSVSLGRWQKWVLAIIPPTLATPVLELGFGPGHLLEALDRIDPHVYGIDLSKQMCSLAKKRLRRFGRDPMIIRASSEGIPFASESMSTIFATFPAPNIFSVFTAREIYRILKPGGALVVLLLVHLTGSSLQERLVRSLFRLTGSQRIKQPMIETLFSAMIKAGFAHHVEVIPFGKDELITVKMVKRQLSNS